ncbi:MAG: phosphatidate cytidylyltransferase [bacterium]|nr:phosphatidate cytidylyltransferase [bacterium]
MSTVDAAGSSLSRGAKIWRRTVVGAAIAAAVALLLFVSTFDSGTRFVHLAGGVIAVCAMLEIGRMGFPLRGVDVKPLVVAAVAVHLVGWALWSSSSEIELLQLEGASRYWWGLLILPATALAFAFLASLPSLGAERARTCFSPLYLFAALWVAVPMGELFLVRMHAGTAGLVALVLLSKVGDIAGYYFGNLLGRTHPFPNLSPGKTTAGCVASLVAGIVTGIACQMGGLLPPDRFGLVSGIFLGATLNLAAQAGDLLESAVKRRAGVKDSGTLFGPSGGLLDLVDSLLLSIPVALLVGPLLYHWPFEVGASL